MIKGWILVMKLSVIIPVYNVAEYLSATLESVIKQDLKCSEIILVDDGSIDGSARICDDYAARYDNVKVYHILNGGVSNARNFGLSKARGEYVHFMDSDDTLEDFMYASFMEIVKSDFPDVIVCGCKRIDVVNGSMSVACNEDDIFLSEESKLRGFLDLLEERHKRWMLDYVWNKWYKREVLLANEIVYDTTLSLGEDFLFNCQVFSKVKNVYINKELYYCYYIRNSGLVTAFQSEPWITRKKLHDAHKELYKSHDILENNYSAIKYEDGLLAFSALRSVNSQRCKLTKKEKDYFYRQMLSSQLMELCEFYLKNSSKKLHKLWLFLMKRMGILGVKIVIYADKIDRMRKR